MTSLIVAGAPRNMRGAFGKLVESDVFDICGRIKALDGGENLVIHAMEPGESAYNFVITDLDKNGIPYMVAGYNELDARIVQDLQYVLHVPSSQRYEEAKRREAKSKKDFEQANLDRQVDRLAGPMYSMLDKCGFTQRSDSYAKRNKTAQRARNAA